MITQFKIFEGAKFKIKKLDSFINLLRLNSGKNLKLSKVELKKVDIYFLKNDGKEGLGFWEFEDK